MHTNAVHIFRLKFYKTPIPIKNQLCHNLIHSKMYAGKKSFTFSRQRRRFVWFFIFIVVFQNLELHCNLSKTFIMIYLNFSKSFFIVTIPLPSWLKKLSNSFEWLNGPIKSIKSIINFSLHCIDADIYFLKDDGRTIVKILIITDFFNSHVIPLFGYCKLIYKLHDIHYVEWKKLVFSRHYKSEAALWDLVCSTNRWYGLYWFVILVSAVSCGLDLASINFTPYFQLYASIFSNFELSFN